MFPNRVFFSFALGIWRADTGILFGASEGVRDGTCVSTLGSCAIYFEWVDTADGNTLGVSVSILTGSGIVSILFNCFANVSKALRTGSPASKLGVVVDGGFVRMVMISVAACLRKSTSLTCGNGTLVGKNVTVSHVLVCFVRGK